MTLVGSWCHPWVAINISEEYFTGLNNHSVTVALCGTWGGFLILPSSEEASSDKEFISVFTACGFQNARQLSTVHTL